MSDDLRVSDPSARVSLIGRLLISPPQLGDPNFERSVVLMLAHNADGALGLVLNQPTALACSEVVPSWGEAICAPTNVFSGGPVETQAIIALARTARRPQKVQEAEYEYREYDEGRGVTDLSDQVVFQDWLITAALQAGWRSRGYQEPYLAAQETRVRRFHEVLNDYLAGRPPGR